MTTGVVFLDRLRAAADRRLDRMLARPLGKRLDPFLGIGDLRRRNPLLALIPMTVLFVLGVLRSEFGHMDTVPGILPIMALVSGLNPLAGILSALAYGVGDLLQKFAIDDVFYEGARTAGDYWGARIGYLIAYSSLLLFGVLPGALSRVGRRIALRVVADQRGGIGGPPGPVVEAGANAVAGLIGAVLGGVAGTLGASALWRGTVAPAFFLRPSPDHSCYVLSGSNVTAAIPPASIAAGVGGGAATLAAPGPTLFGGSAPPATGAPPGLPGGSAPPGSSSGGPGTPVAPGPPASTSGSAAPATPPVTEGVVVSGPEAVSELIAAGFPTVTRGGVTFVMPPTGPSGSITGIGFGPTTTLPTGEVVLDPNTVAIVKQVPVTSGPTTTVQGGPAVNTLVNEGFPTYTDAKGNVYVRHPPNLIHGNVTGIAVEGTTTVDGIEVIDPTKGIVVNQAGPPTAGPSVSTGGSAATGGPAAGGTATTGGVPPGGATPPGGTPPVGPGTTGGPGTSGPTTLPPPPGGTATPPADPSAGTGSQPATTPSGPARTPTDASSLANSLTQPGTTVITPDNVPAFVPDALTSDGKIKINDPKAPDVFKKLDGTKAPTPTIGDGTVGVDLPMRLGHVDVKLKVEGGRLVGDTTTSGVLKGLEEASTFAHMANPSMPELDAGVTVQKRIDRYNRMIDKAGLEVKSVTADGGQVKIVTGPK